MRANLVTLVMMWWLFATATRLRAEDLRLVDAAEQLNRAEFKRLLNEGADIRAAQADGMTALHWAVYHDDLQMAKQLLHSGAEANTATAYGVLPLSLACENGNGELVELLLGAGADPNTTLSGSETALMTAARTGRPTAVKALLDGGADVNARQREGQTALMWAAAEGHAEVVSMLLEAGADHRTPLASGFTPLLFAVRDGHSEVAGILLKAGADVNEAMMPKMGGVRAPRRGTSALILAVENGHFELAIQLLEAGADPNDQRSGYSALHTLTWVRKPNRGDGEDGDPPPSGSGDVHSLDFAREVVARGADVNLQLKRGPSSPGMISRVGATPLLMAAATADVPYLRTLVELGADPLLANADQCTPLMAAAGVGTRAPGEEAGTEPEALEAVALLIGLGGDVNTVDANGETAMHGAAFKSLPKMVRLLAERGARADIWNQPNKYGWTPLAIARGHRHGNFKPSAETAAAIEDVMRAAGLSIPAP